MGKQRWLDNLQRQLIGRNLPSKYVQRFLEEAADHLEDLMEETMEKTDFSARMGESEHVAEAAVAEYRRRGFLGRHPAAAFLTFAVSPLLAFLVLMFAALIALVSASQWIGLIDNDGLHLGAAGRVVIACALPLTVIALPAMLLSFLYCRLARRTAIGTRWMLASCGALVVISSATYCQLTYAGMSAHGCLFVFFGAKNAMQIAQFAIAAAFSWWLIRRSGQGQPRLAE
jgi:hypothetical protein